MQPGPSIRPWRPGCSGLGRRGTDCSCAIALASRRISTASDPKATARPASELAAAAGQTITRDGLPASEVLRIRRGHCAGHPGPGRPVEPGLHPAALPAPHLPSTQWSVATTSSPAPGRPARAPSSPRTRRSPGWCSCSVGSETAGGCFVSGGTMGNLSALLAARSGPYAARPASKGSVATCLYGAGALLGAGRSTSAGRAGSAGRGGRARPAHRAGLAPSTRACA